MSWPFVSSPIFLFQVWPDSEWNQDSVNHPGELLRPLTRSCFLLLVPGRLFLLALPVLLGICLPSRWSPPFPLHALALIPLSLAHLDSLPLIILVLWTDGFFPFGKSGSGVFANCSLCGTEAALSFSAGPVCSSFFRWSLRHSARALLVSAAPTSLPFLFSSSTIWLSFCPLLHLSFYLKLCGRSGRNCLLSPHVLSDYNGSPDTRFSRGTTQPMSWPDGVLISDWRRTVSSKYFDTQVPSISPEELLRLRCNGHSLLLGSYFSRIGRIENLFFSACGHSSQDISDLILHCPATDSLRRSLFGDSLSFYDLWSRPWGVARLLGIHGLPPCPHHSEGVG